MNYHHFLERLPNLYEHWGTPEVRPKSDRFQAVLARVRGMTSANVLQLLNLAVELMEQDEVYVEVGCLQGATLIGALLGNSARIAYATDNFTEYDRDGSNQAMLLKNLESFGLQDRVRLRRHDFGEFFLKLRLASGGVCRASPDFSGPQKMITNVALTNPIGWMRGTL